MYKRRTIPGLEGKELSPVVLGCDSEPFKKGEDLDEFLEGVLATGLNVFDTARKYGESEVSIGHWLKNHPERREEIVLISKGCHPHADGRSRLKPDILKKEIEESLSRLNTSYIDIYFLHRDDHRADLKEILSILDSYHKAGKIRIYGGSNWTAKRIKEANQIAKENNFAPFMASSPNASLAIWEKDPWRGGDGCVSLNSRKYPEEFDFYKETKMPLFTYSSLARGFLTGRVKTSNLKEGKKTLDMASKYAYWSKENIERLRRAEELSSKKNCSVSQIALAYLLNQPLNLFPIVATTKVKRVEENLKAAEITLTSEELSYLSYQED